MEDSTLLQKVRQQENPIVLFSDIDGTLFSPNFNLITSPVFNIQTTANLKERTIPFVIVTGRSFWRRVDQYHLKLLGVPEPDAVITANGSIIFYKTRSGYVSDFVWQGAMQSTKVTDTQGNSESWNKSTITSEIKRYLEESSLPYVLGKGNTYLIRIKLNKYPVSKIEKLRKDILQLFPKGIRVILTEKLLWENSLQTFSGEMLITPSTAGKDKALQYVLKNLAINKKQTIHGLIFGDATVDLPMLTMKEDAKYYTLSQYGVHPTPLAYATLTEKAKTNQNIKILLGDGPKEILWTLRPDLRKNSGSEFVVRSSEKKTMNYEQTNNELAKQLSPAQNNQARKVIRVFEGFLDRLVDKNLSPNEISFLGLQKLSTGLKLLQQNNAPIPSKAKGLYHYAFGNLTDILDGIRARRSDKKEDNGQLVDGFSDRAKEFMQLFSRAKKRMHSNENPPLLTLLAALSCALPSIARAQVEISGKTVAEKDEKGGSMIDRTRRLFLSLLFDTFGVADQSEAVDEKILETNIATFQHRLTYSSNKTGSSQLLRTIKIEHMNDFQKKALERFLLYVDVLQQEDKIIKKYLAKYTELSKQYEKESKKLAKVYLEIPVNSLRKKWGIKDYKLEIKKYL